MRSLTLLASLLLLPSTLATLDTNLNYASPSRRDAHARLGIDKALVTRRSWKRDSVPRDPSSLHFSHGVASGDPFPDSVILWTRVAPTEESSDSTKVIDGAVDLYDHETEKWVKADPQPVCVEWKVFKKKCDDGESVKKVVSSGTAYTSGDIDYTVKVEATGLQPFKEYFYQFNVCGSDVKSPIGRTKTAPTADDDVSKIKLAVFSCANYPNGYFNVYGNAARKDMHDYVVHLGDYIYETAGTGERATKPDHATFTLHDYRTRHNQYRTDPDLQLLAKDFAWMPTWDDHEFSNNEWKDGPISMNNTEESFLYDAPDLSVDSRKINAVRAYFEWMPIRQTDLDDGLRVWRSFQLGKLMDLIILDTRNYDRGITSMGWNDEYIDLIRDDPSRSMMGPRQESWFYHSLKDSQDRGATWRVVANQLLFSRIIGEEGVLSTDDWNAYIANRNRTLKHIYDNEINNNIFLAGDSHQNWVSDLVWLGEKGYDNESGEGAVGVEFAGTAISSSGVVSGPIEPTAGDASRGFIERNEEMMWQEAYYRGYMYLEISKNKVTNNFYGSPSLTTRNAWDIPLANFTVKSGANHLKRPIAGGQVESGALRGGEVKHTNLTLNTETNVWKVIGFDTMFIDQTA